jgi:MFS family permease
MSIPTTAIRETKPAAVSEFHTAFIAAWLFCLLFYFVEYAVRSAPSVMLPELTTAFGLTTLGLSSLIGLYYYTYAVFAIIAGASVDRWGAKYTIPIGVLLLAVGTAMFGVNVSWIAALGRLLQGAGAAFAFVAAVYLAAHGLPARYLATAIGITQCIGMLGGAAGQFVTAPLIHGPLHWQQFWMWAGVVTLLIAVAMLIVTPREHQSPGSTTSIWSTFAPYKIVLANPQSYLCGLVGGLLFLPTTVGAMTWGVSFLQEGWHVGYTQAVDRAATVAMGWVFGCPDPGVHRRPYRTPQAGGARWSGLDASSYAGDRFRVIEAAISTAKNLLWQTLKLCSVRGADAGSSPPLFGPILLGFPFQAIRRAAPCPATLGRNPFESARQTLPMYKHAEHRPHWAANKHQQRQNHPRHHECCLA